MTKFKTLVIKTFALFFVLGAAVSHATEVEDYLKNVEEAVALLTRLQSKTVVTRMKVTEEPDANRLAEIAKPSRSRQSYRTPHISAMHRNECLTGTSDAARSAKSNAVEKAIQVCRAKGASACESMPVATAFEYAGDNIYAGSCTAITTLTIQ